MLHTFFDLKKTFTALALLDAGGGDADSRDVLFFVV
jgi:hypothetical protein